VKDTNKYLTDKAPWNMKNDAASQAVVVRSTLEAIYVAAHYLAPFIPAAADTIFVRLNTPPRPLWALGAGFANLAVGTPVLSGDILFAKFEPKAPEASAPPPARKPAKPAGPAADAPVDVSRLDIRVGQILKARGA
jgi:methionyl-tRNA synthetase